MLEIIEGFPGNVIAVKGKGRVTASDYDEVLMPRVRETLKKHHAVRCYYELGHEFTGIDPGAAWKDLEIGVGHLARWERMALVTDVEWIRLAVRAFGFLMPGKLRVFPAGEAEAARTWIGGS